MSAHPVADIILPAIRWDAEQGYEPYRERIAKWQALGVGGFILFGGEKEATRALIAELRAGAQRNLLIASDLERGAGQQIRGLTSLPPLLALASLGAAAVEEAALITAQEARDIGINWIFSPVCDLDIEPLNPIVQTRSFGSDAFDAGYYAAIWIRTCQSAGVLACAKHFPGHGRTTMDSHATLPVVKVGRELERDLLPFRRAVQAGVGAMMTAHVAFPAWDPSGAPATHSRAIMHDLLRGDLFFDGIVVTDALIMEGAKGGASEADGCIRALRAGVDLLLYPHDPEAVIEGLEVAVLNDRGLEEHIAGASLRRQQAAHRQRPSQSGAGVPALPTGRGEALCRESVKMLRGDLPRLSGNVAIEIVDDDLGGPYPLPPRDAFERELKKLGVGISADGQKVVLVFADVKSWKGRAGLSQESMARLATLVSGGTPVVVFGHPRRQVEVPGLGAVVCAWSGDEAMQRAAAQRLATH
jgi:beta-glucosidase-like glycosyl hydrolase